MKVVVFIGDLNDIETAIEGAEYSHANNLYELEGHLIRKRPVLYAGFPVTKLERQEAIKLCRQYGVMNIECIVTECYNEAHNQFDTWYEKPTTDEGFMRVVFQMFKWLTKKKAQEEMKNNRYSNDGLYLWTPDCSLPLINASRWIMQQETQRYRYMVSTMHHSMYYSEMQRIFSICEFYNNWIKEASK